VPAVPTDVVSGSFHAQPVGSVTFARVCPTVAVKPVGAVAVAVALATFTTIFPLALL